MKLKTVERILSLITLVYAIAMACYVVKVIEPRKEVIPKENLVKNEVKSV